MWRNERNEFGGKQLVRIKVDGELIDRGFRNRGEAIEWLKRHMDMDKREIDRRVRFV